MAYYTGTDVKIWVCTEHASKGILLETHGEREMMDLTTSFSAGDVKIPPRTTHLGYTGFNLADITGVDLSIGAQDEEISYFGTKTPGKSEVKSDCSVTITRKKGNPLFQVMAQGRCKTGASQDATGVHGAKWGVILGNGLAAGDAANLRIANGTTDPKSSLDDASTVSYGYRVAIQLKAASGSAGANKDGTVIVLRNCSLGDYTHTTSNDAANDETVSFVTMVSPLILNGKLVGNVFDGAETATAAADM